MCLADLELQAGCSEELSYSVSVLSGGAQGSALCQTPRESLLRVRKRQLLLLKMMSVFGFRFKIRLSMGLHLCHSKER